MGMLLGGMRVIDLGQIFAAPYCTMQLAQIGADYQDRTARRGRERRASESTRPNSSAACRRVV
jgi:crotonobetainyl-CoA:carnitine CoA-transferase CaiB-like acyl-CoA transferase